MKASTMMHQTARRGLDFDDLEQEARMRLMVALRRETEIDHGDTAHELDPGLAAGETLESGAGLLPTPVTLTLAPVWPRTIERDDLRARIDGPPPRPPLDAQVSVPAQAV